MPDPTREQFNAAAQRVMATAPEGLSREAFYALVDQELGGGTPGAPQFKPGASLPGARVSSDSEQPSALKSMLGHAAEPTSVGDVLSMFMPDSNVMSTAMRATGRGLQSAGRATEPLAKYGLLESVLGRDWKGAVAAASPYAAQKVGSGMEKLGNILNPSRGVVPFSEGEVLPPRVMEGEFAEVPKPSTAPGWGTDVSRRGATAAGASSRPSPMSLQPHPQGALPEPTAPWEQLDAPKGPPTSAGPSSLSNRPGLPGADSTFEMPESGIRRLDPGSTSFQMPESSLESIRSGQPQWTPAAIPSPAESLKDATDPVLMQMRDRLLGKVKYNPLTEEHTPAGDSGPVGRAAEAMMTGGSPASQPLGQPRVLNWKPGAGPNPNDAQALRGQYGSNAAARILATNPTEVKAMAPQWGSPQLPSAVQERIRGAMSGMSPEDMQAYLQRAPNSDTIKAFINSIIQGR